MEYPIDNNRVISENDNRQHHNKISIKLAAIIVVAVMVVTIGFFFWFNCRFLVQCKTPANLSIDGAIIKKNEQIQLCIFSHGT